MVNADKKQNLMITMLVVGMFVLLAVVCWQQVMIKQAFFGKDTYKHGGHALYQDVEHGFQIVTTKECKDVFEVKASPGSRKGTQSDYSTIKNLALHLQNPISWVKEQPIRYYTVMDPKEVQRVVDDGNIFWPGNVEFYTKTNDVFINFGLVGESATAENFRNSTGGLCDWPKIQQIQ